MRAAIGVAVGAGLALAVVGCLDFGLLRRPYEFPFPDGGSSDLAGIDLAGIDGPPPCLTYPAPTPPAKFVYVRAGAVDGGTTTVATRISDAVWSDAKPGDVVLVAGGTYSESVLIQESITLVGGFSDDFSCRDIVASPTVVKAPAGHPALKVEIGTGATRPIVAIDGIGLYDDGGGTGGPIVAVRQAELDLLDVGVRAARGGAAIALDCGARLFGERLRIERVQGTLVAGDDITGIELRRVACPNMGDEGTITLRNSLVRTVDATSTGPQRGIVLASPGTVELEDSAVVGGPGTDLTGPDVGIAALAAAAGSNVILLRSTVSAGGYGLAFLATGKLIMTDSLVAGGVAGMSALPRQNIGSLWQGSCGSHGMNAWWGGVSALLVEGQDVGVQGLKEQCGGAFLDIDAKVTRDPGLDSADGYHLVGTSPLINAAGSCPPAGARDVDLEPRPDTQSNLCDIGADERW